MTGFTYIDTQEALDMAGRQWTASPDVGVDLECENNLHYYGAFISLIQVSSREQHWIVDVLRLKQVEPVLKMLENASIQKIFHNANFDIRILHHQFKCRPRNIFDTEIAALLLGRRETGLGSLLQHFFGVKKEQHFQMADWTRRPLTGDMIEYALKDTMYLIPLRDILENELREKNRLSWAVEEFKIIEEGNLTYEEKTYLDFPGIKQLSDRERFVLKHLFSLRKRMAERINRPPYFIMKTKRLTELVTNPPNSLNGWENLRGVHPIVRAEAKLFFDAVMQGKRKEITPKTAKTRKYTQKQKDDLDRLSELRNKIAEELGIQKHLILNREQMQDIILTGTLHSLRQWQKNLLTGQYKIRLA